MNREYPHPEFPIWASESGTSYPHPDLDSTHLPPRQGAHDGQSVATARTTTPFYPY